MVSGEQRVSVPGPTTGYNNNSGSMDISIESVAATDHRAASLAWVQIVEQTTRKKIRIRYETELTKKGQGGNIRSAGSIPGANSTADNKTYPTIKVVNNSGRKPIIIYASCITKDYKAHPHRLVGPNCYKGVFILKQEVSEQHNEFQLKDVGVVQVKNDCVDASLREREAQKIDPFNKGFTHTRDSIDLLAFRIAFQVFIQKPDGKFYMLPAVATNVVYNKRAKCELKIVDSSHTVGHDAGGLRLFLLCDHIVRTDRVEFYREAAQGGAGPGWCVEVQPQVHHCLAAIVPTPPYTCRDFASDGYENIEVKYRLKRKTEDGQVMYSKPFPFNYIPNPQDLTKRKFVMRELLQDYDDDALKKLKLKPSRVSKKSDRRKERAPKVVTTAVSTHTEHTCEWQNFGMLPSTATRSPEWNTTTSHSPASQLSYTTPSPLQHSSNIHSMQNSPFTPNSLALQSSLSTATPRATTTPYFGSPYSDWAASQSSLSTAPALTMQDQPLSQSPFTEAASLPYLPQVAPRYTMENPPCMVQHPPQSHLLPDPSHRHLTAADTSYDIWPDQQQSAGELAPSVFNIQPAPLPDINDCVESLSDELRRLCA